MSQIQPVSLTVDTIFKAYEEIVVPLNQRGFEWGREQASDFWEDVVDAVEEGKKIFLGTLVIKTQEGSNTCSVVDGQQRLTTISLLLIALRQVEMSLKLRDAAKQLTDTYLGSSDIMATSYKPKLKVSTLIADTYNEMVGLGWDGEFSQKINGKALKRQVKKIRPVYELLVEKIHEHNYDRKDAILPLLDAVRNKCYFVVIKISDDLEALEIFERMNARGIELNAAELLKNHLFTTELPEDEITTEWDEIFKNSDNDLAKVLRYFYISQKGHIRKDQLYKETKQLIREIGARNFLTRFRLFSKHYFNFSIAERKDLEEYVKNSLGNIEPIKEYVLDEICDSFEALRLFKVSQHLPLIGAAFEKIFSSREVGGKQSEKFARLLHALESFHFINNAICKKPNNEIERFYAEMCKEIAMSTALTDGVINKVITGLAQRKEKFDSFADNFSEISYDQGEQYFRMLYYIFDRMNNAKRKGAERINIYSTDLRISKGNYNIDHMNPKKSDLYNCSIETDKDYINSIGNLIVIPLHSNSRAHNMSLISKVDEIYRTYNTNLPTVLEFVNGFDPRDWKTKEDIFASIDKRVKYLTEKAYKEVWTL